MTCGIFDKETDWMDLIMTGSALERCSEAFARSATSLILLEKDLITEIGKAIYNLNLKLMGVSDGNLLKMNMIVTNF